MIKTILWWVSFSAALAAEWQKQAIKGVKRA